MTIVKYYDLAKWLSHYLYFFSFLFIFGLTIQGRSAGKYHIICHMSHDESYDECGKVVHRPCSKCISSIQKLNENSIEFSLSTWYKGNWSGLQEKPQYIITLRDMLQLTSRRNLKE